MNYWPVGDSLTLDQYAKVLKNQKILGWKGLPLLGRVLGLFSLSVLHNMEARQIL